MYDYIIYTHTPYNTSINFSLKLTKSSSVSVSLYAQSAPMKPSLVSAFHRSSQSCQNIIPKNPFGKNISSKEEELAFVKIFERIMNKNKVEVTEDDDKVKNNNSRKIIPGTNDNKESLQLVFEKSLNILKDHNKDKISNESLIKKYPNKTRLKVNLYDLMKQDEHNVTILQNLEKKTSLQKSLSSTFNKLQKISSDYGIINFLNNEVIYKYHHSDQIPVKFSQTLLNQIEESSVKDPLKPMLNQFTLPMLLQKGLNLLNFKFQSPLEALTIFEKAKKLDLKTFTYGITIEVYNEVLNIYWRFFKDINNIVNVIEELKINGIQGNMDTITILQKISKEYHSLIDDDEDVFDLFKINEFEKIPIWNKKDEDDLLIVDQYISDLFKVIK